MIGQELRVGIGLLFGKIVNWHLQQWIIPNEHVKDLALHQQTNRSSPRGGLEGNKTLFLFMTRNKGKHEIYAELEKNQDWGGGYLIVEQSTEKSTTNRPESSLFRK